MIALLDTVVLVVGSRFSSLLVFHANLLWLEVFLLRYQLTALWELSSVTDHLSLAAFRSLSLPLTFALLIMYLGVGLFGFILLGTYSASWTLNFFFTRWGKFSVITSSSQFSVPYSLFSTGISMMWKLLHMILSQRSLNLSSVFWILSFLYLGCLLLSCSLNCWFDPLLNSTCCWFPLLYSVWFFV